MKNINFIKNIISNILNGNVILINMFYMIYVSCSVNQTAHKMK